jgi:transcriptional regulator with XRE-family HTH domain
MHALGRFITDLMDARSMSRPDLERASGLSRQHIHQLLDDRRTSLGRMVDDTTVVGLSRAFADIGETAFILKAAESLGVPVDRLATVDVDIDRLSDDALLGILARRLKRTGSSLKAVDRPSVDQPSGEPAAGPRADGTEEPAPLAARHGTRARQRLDQEWGDPDGVTPG